MPEEDVRDKIIRLGYVKFDGDLKESPGAQLIDGEWYSPKWGCDTIQNIIDEW